MDTFSIIRDALDRSASDPDKIGMDPRVRMAGRVIEAVQTVVDTLTPPDGGRYIVSFADVGTAGTALGTRRIVVSSKPLNDLSLSLVEKAVVIATLAAHEIGHTMVTRPRREPVDVVGVHNAHSGYHTVANLADDIILEPFMVDRFPILADAFEFTGLWVLRSGSADRLPLVDTLNRGTTTAGRFNIILHATRYGDIPEIEWRDENVCAERDWARDWSRRLLALRLLDHGGFIAACDEVWERIRTVDETPEPEPEPPVITEPGDEPDDEDGDDEDEDGDEPPTTDGPTGPGGDEPDDEPGEGKDGELPNPDRPGDDWDDDGKDGDGEDDDEPGGDTGSGDSEPDDPADDGDGDGDGGDDDGDEPVDETTDDGDHDYTGHESGEATDDAEGGGGNAEADANTLRDEDDFDQDEVDETTHEQASTEDGGDDDTQSAVRTYEATTVTRFGLHGSMSTTWD